MSNKSKNFTEVMIRTRVSTELKDAFAKKCQDNYESQSTIMRTLVRKYVEGEIII